jgi:hypothetical protein
MTLVDIIKVIGVVFGVLVGSLGLYITFRKRTLWVPKVQLDFGLSSHLRRKLAKKNRKRPVSLLIIGVPKPKYEEDVICTIPCVIENNSPHPLKKVTLQFEFPVGFGPPDQSKVGEIFADQIRLLQTEKFTPALSVHGYLQTRRNFEIVRSGEIIIHGEPLGFKPFGMSFSKKTPVGHHVHLLSELLKDQESVVSICPLKLFFYSEELSMIQQNITIIWVKADSLSELSENFHSIVRRIWKNTFGEKKWLIKYPWEKLEESHLAVIMQPEYMTSEDGSTRLMDRDVTLDQMSISEVRLPHIQPFRGLD